MGSRKLASESQSSTCQSTVFEPITCNPQAALVEMNWTIFSVIYNYHIQIHVAMDIFRLTAKHPRASIDAGGGG